MARLTEEEFLRQRMERDRKMMLTPGDWPKWPMLPLKRRDGDAIRDDYCCLLLNDPLMAEGPVTVYFDNLFRIPQIVQEIKQETGSEHVDWGQIRARLKGKEFASLDELLAEYTVD